MFSISLPMAVRARTLLLAVLLSGTSGCAAIYPELSAPLRASPEDEALDPPPPSSIVYVAIEGGSIPTKTRDGRAWDEVGGTAPDPFAMLVVNGEELLRTDVARNTTKPQWGTPSGNYRIAPGSRVEIRVWDENFINARPICAEVIPDFQDQISYSETVIVCKSGARIKLRLEPAKAKIGAGFFYELRNDQVFVTRVLEESPARRIGIEAGDEIVKIEQRRVAKMEEAEVRSIINAKVRSGLSLVVRGIDGKAREVKLIEGPIYPLVSEHVIETK